VACLAAGRILGDGGFEGVIDGDDADDAVFLSTTA
jgi:hypothetical protein